jgi:uncharacterized DUF497 family protein
MLIFYWNEWNIEHIAEHDVRPEEAKEVARGAVRPFAMNMGNGKWMVRGPTSHGRYLQVIYVYRGVEDIDLDSVEPEDRIHIQEVEEVGYVIHARELTVQERHAVRRILRGP